MGQDESMDVCEILALKVDVDVTVVYCYSNKQNIIYYSRLYIRSVV